MGTKPIKMTELEFEKIRNAVYSTYASSANFEDGARREALMAYRAIKSIERRNGYDTLLLES